MYVSLVAADVSLFITMICVSPDITGEVVTWAAVTTLLSWTSLEHRTVVTATKNRSEEESLVMIGTKLKVDWSSVQLIQCPGKKGRDRHCPIVFKMCIKRKNLKKNVDQSTDTVTFPPQSCEEERVRGKDWRPKIPLAPGDVSWNLATLSFPSTLFRNGLKNL